jgi:hypothetical protein
MHGMEVNVRHVLVVLVVCFVGMSCFQFFVGDMPLKEAVMAFKRMKSGSLEGFCHLMRNSNGTAMYAHFFWARGCGAFT